MQNSKEVVITDMGGIIYSFSKTFDPIEHEKVFNTNLAWYAQNEERFSNVLEKEKIGDIELALEAEKISIKKWFNSPEVPGTLPIFFNIDALQYLVQNAKKYKIVVVSTSKVTTSMLILEKGMEIINESPLLVKEFDIIDMSIFGSKKKSEDWVKVLKMYANVVAIVEDNEMNLEAAITAATSLQLNVQKSLEMDLF